MDTQRPSAAVNSPGHGPHLLGGADMAQRTCLTDGCEYPVHGLDLCKLHYRRVRRYGAARSDIPERRQLRGDPWARLMSAVLVTPSGCWEWQRAKNVWGYGRVRISGSEVGAHRWAWELANGPIPSGMLVCHTCDNPPCCNPAHLFIGAPMENTRDMMAKGRHNHEAAVRGGRAGGRVTGDRLAQTECGVCGGAYRVVASGRYCPPCAARRDAAHDKRKSDAQHAAEDAA